MQKKRKKRGIILCTAGMIMLCAGMFLKHYKYIVRIKNDYQNRLTDHQVRYLAVYSKGLTVKDIKWKKIKCLRLEISGRNDEYIAKVLKIC